MFLLCREHHFRTKDFLLKQNKIKQRVYLMLHFLSFSPSFLKSKIRSQQLPFLDTIDIPCQDKQPLLYLSKYLNPYNPNRRIKVGAANKDLKSFLLHKRGHFLTVRMEFLCSVRRAIEDYKMSAWTESSIPFYVASWGLTLAISSSSNLAPVDWQSSGNWLFREHL